MNSLIEKTSFNEEIEFINKFDPSSFDTALIQSYKGKIYKKISFECHLEEFLTIKLQDSETSSWIYGQYKEIILPTMGNDQQAIEILENWIKQNCFLLQIGSSSAEEDLKKHHQLLPYLPSIETFLKSINKSETIISQEIKRIAIVIPTKEQAEEMVARALEVSLSKRGYVVEVISEEQEDCSFYHFSGMSIHDLWKEIFQKRRDKELVNKSWQLWNRVPDFIPTDSMGILRRRVEAFKPDFVFTTRHDYPSHVALARKCQMAYVLCDFVFNPKLVPLALKVDPHKVKFCVPAVSMIPKGLEDRVFLLGYPIRLGIKRLENISLVRENWGIKTDEKVVMLQMGRQGMGGLPLIVQKIIEGELRLPPAVFVVVTGNNSAMKNEIEKLALSLSKESPIRLQVHGSLNELQMNELLNISSLAIGKGGGSTTAELIYMGVFAILFSSWSPEKSNIYYMREMGLALEMEENSYDNIVSQILEQLQKDKIKTFPIDWESQVEKLISISCQPLQAGLGLFPK